MTETTIERARAASDLGKPCCFPRCTTEAEYAAVFYGKSCDCPVLVCDDHRRVCLAEIERTQKHRWHCTVCNDRGWELVGFAAL